MLALPMECIGRVDRYFCTQAVDWMLTVQLPLISILRYTLLVELVSGQTISLCMPIAALLSLGVWQAKNFEP